MRATRPVWFSEANILDDLRTRKEISFHDSIPMSLGKTGSRRTARTSSRRFAATPKRKLSDVRVHPRHHAGSRFGQGARPGGLRRPRRRVPRRLVDRGPVPSALRACPGPLCGCPRRRLRQQRIERQPVCAERPDQPQAGQKHEAVRQAAAGARRRGADRGLRISHHRQPDHPKPAAARRRRHRTGHLRRHPGAARRGRRTQDPGDHDGAHPGQPLRPRHRAGAVRQARPVADRGLLRRARLDLRRQAHRQFRRHRDLELLSRPPHHHRRGWRRVRQVGAGPQAGRVVPRLGPGLLLRARQRQHLPASGSSGSSATCPRATTTNTSTATSATT